MIHQVFVLLFLFAITHSFRLAPPTDLGTWIWVTLQINCRHHHVRVCSVPFMRVLLLLLLLLVAEKGASAMDSEVICVGPIASEQLPPPFLLCNLIYFLTYI